MIYTSYYANPKLRDDRYCKISISLYKPRYNKIDFHLKKLSPTKEMLDLDLSNDAEFDEYNEKFNAILSLIDPIQMSSEIKSMAKDKIPVLLCYEKDHETCHRWDVSEWFLKYGIECMELA